MSKNIRCRENLFREWFGFCVIFLRVKNGLLIRFPSIQTEPLFFTASREPPFLLRLTSVRLPSVTSVMMTSSNGSIPPVTSLLWGEFISHRWIPLTKASDAELSLIRVRTNSWVNNRDVGDLRRHHAHHDVTVMMYSIFKCVAVACHKIAHNSDSPLPREGSICCW